MAKWQYVCMDCGRKMRNDVNSCPRCLKIGHPGDRVARICCNTCRHASYDESISDVCPLSCSKDGKQHELGDYCTMWHNMDASN